MSLPVLDILPVVFGWVVLVPAPLMGLGMVPEGGRVPG